MRLLDRYLFRELLVPLGFCLCGFLIFWISFDLFSELEDLQQHKLLRAGDITAYYCLKLPEFLVIILPIALLLALLYALTNHSRHNELTAIRAAGVSLWRLCAPYFFVGLAMSMMLLALNELCVPSTNDMAERILIRRIIKKASGENSGLQKNFGFTNSRDLRTWHAESYNMQTFEMTEPRVDCSLPNGAYRELIAKRAVYAKGGWVFYDVLEQIYSSTTNPVPNRKIFSTLAVPEFSETPEEIRSEIKISNRLSLHTGKKPDIPLMEIFSYLHLHPKLSRTDKSWLYTKLYGRLAVPWTCLIVVLIAIPFGAASGRRNVFVGVASSILICFVYFTVQQICLALGGGGYLPSWFAAWFPNLSFGIAGLWLTTKVR